MSTPHAYVESCLSIARGFEIKARNARWLSMVSIVAGMLFLLGVYAFLIINRDSFSATEAASPIALVTFITIFVSGAGTWMANKSHKESRYLARFYGTLAKELDGE